MADTGWQPSAALAALERRAVLLAQLRAFFAARGVLELEVPLLGSAGVTDVHIENLVVAGAPEWYLQSSPEYFLKRFLARHTRAVYCLGKAFRAGERGRLHQPEFTLLEWYRPGWDEDALIAEVAELLVESGAGAGHCTLDYGTRFAAAVGIDPHAAPDAELRARAAAAAGDSGARWRDQPRGICLDLLFSSVVQPRLPPGVVFVTRYPACQAALARLERTPAGVVVARRFEVFVDGVELGNGYWELTDAEEQRRRFAEDVAQRAALGRPRRVPDQRLLAAIDAGLPPCAGVALGVDRLLMGLLGAVHIREVLAFAEE